MFLRKKEEKTVNVAKVVLITAGVVLAIVAACIALYKFFKKHFKITFECEDCDFCDDDCLSFDDGFEPECISGEDDEEEVEEDEVEEKTDDGEDDIFGDLAAE